MERRTKERARGLVAGANVLINVVYVASLSTRITKQFQLRPVRRERRGEACDLFGNSLSRIH